MQPGSISEGIVFNKVRPTVDIIDDISSKYFLGFGQPLSTAEYRERFYRKLYTQAGETLNKLQQRWSQDFIKNVLEYIENSTQSISDYQETITPVAFLATGLPQDENAQLLSKIREKLTQNTPHVASVNSRTCNNVKIAFQQLCTQLLEHNCDNFFDDTMDSETEGLNVTNVRSKLKFISADDLRSWYKQSEQKPLVIIIEDIDFFPLNVAQNLLMAFSSLKLPVIFIAGITSCCENFDSYVPQRCPTTFLYKTFHLNSPAERLYDFLNEVVLRPDYPLMLSGPIVQFIIQTYLHQGFSCTRLLHIVQLCMLEHFRTAASVLCASDEILQKDIWNSDVLTLEIARETFPDEAPSEIKSIKLKLTGAPNGSYSVSVVRSSPRKLEKKSQVTQTKSNDLESEIIHFCRKKLEWFGCVKLLFAITHDLKMGCSFGDTFSDLYILCWNGIIFEKTDQELDSRFTKFLKLLEEIHSTSLKLHLNQGIKELKNFISYANAGKTEVPQILAKFEEFLIKIENAEEEDKKVAEASKSEPVIKRKMSRTELQNALLKRIKDTKQTSCYTSVRKEIVEYISKDISQYLQPLHKLRYSKAFIFSDTDFLRELHTPNPQKRIHVALLEPCTFFNMSDNEMDPNELKSDVSLVYSLILEQQMRNINVNLIFDSFKSFFDDPAPKKRRTTISKAKEADEQMHLIRFRQAIAELQHMGFLKRSKTKIDEVSRQTFGF